MRKLKKLRCRYHYSLEGKFPLAIKSVDFVRVYKDECENCVQTDYGFFSGMINPMASYLSKMNGIMSKAMVS